MRFLVLFLVSFCLIEVSVGVAQTATPVAQVRVLRLQGDLAEAEQQVMQALHTGDVSPALERALRLELGRIYDRAGLHQNTRPVAAFLEQIEAAAEWAEGPADEAEIALARGEYYYRAEMSTRVFAVATQEVQRAIELFQAVGDGHGEAEAVHRLGLIHMQRGELEPAQACFDRSLELDQEAGARTFFRGEYERHTAFVYLLGGQPEAAIPHFERSWTARKEAGAIDASMFAAGSLASALVNLGRFDEAHAPLLYAMMVAEQLGSPVGKARNGLVLGRLYEQTGDTLAARLAFETTNQIATSVGYASVAQQAEAALERLLLP